MAERHPLALLSTTEAAAVLRVSPAVVTALMDGGDLAEHRLPGRTRGSRKRYTSLKAIEEMLDADVRRQRGVREIRLRAVGPRGSV